ncbi:MAG: Ig-like domain-containing protein [Rhodoglobus sp.]
MNALTKWVKTRKTTATALVIAVVAGVPLTIAALHPGFPISNVDLTSRDVWVTNGEKLLGGRLNRQIDELNGSVVASSPNFDVLQDGDTVFMVDPDAGRVEAVNPASTEVTSSIDIPKGAEVGYGGSVLAIMSPTGDLWAIPSVGDLKFNYVSAPPIIKLGKGAHIAVSRLGTVIAVSPEHHKLYRIASLADAPQSKDFPDVGAFQLAAVGEQAVVFDQSTDQIVTEGGSKYGIGSEKGLKLQLTGPDSRYAVVATADSLVRVDLGSGAAQTESAGFDSKSSDTASVAAPVNQAGCANGAWSSKQRYLLACEGQKAVPQDIEQPTTGSFLAFRVNRTVIALNDLSNGNVWLPSENMRLVDNWDDVTPPEKKDSEETGKEKSSIQSFEDTLAQRTDTNRPPTAVDDKFGIRPGRTTILSVLDNDSDPDGDVLVISDHDAVAESTGHLDLIDGGRALQFTPAPDFVGTINFNYTVDDGRGGTASANVSAHVVPEGINNPPISLRKPGVSVEANQTVSYNVLSDWRDPDGDDLYLVGASPKSGDLVRFTPDGFITFTHQTSELGEKEVQFQVSDGNGPPVTGILTVDVQPAGSLNPVGTPDFATVFANETVVVKPLTNDISPSGAQLTLVALSDPGKGAVSSFNSDRAAITFSATDAGVYYMEYTLQAASNTSIGIVRVDVLPRPADDKLPPIAVKDTAYMRSDEPVTVSVLSNDVSPTGKILAVQSVTVPPELTAKGLVVELLESTLVRITAPAALTEQVNFTYTISDGVSTATAGVTVVPVPALTKHQPPVALNDAATVRVGDIITLDVLANDFHPDDAPMSLDNNLVTAPTAGLAFVSQDKLRFQAPTTAGEYRAEYRVLDPFGESAVATATFTVTPLNEKANRDPVPEPLIGRVLAGGSIRIDLPLQGIDPDGDSTQLLKFPTNPTLGSIVEKGADYFIYKASDAAAGTDVFSYQVYDAFGATGQASIKIAVIPKPKELQPPTAVPDSVSIRPGRIAQVDLTANDSDPQGLPIKVSKDLVDVPKGIDASVLKGQYLVITAPQTVQSFSLRYKLTNDSGGSVMSYVLVQVTPDAPLLPPSANDIPILTKDIAGKKTYTVDVFDGHAFNPAGKNEDLAITVEGPNAGSATLLAQNGKIEVTPGTARQAIAYRVTNAKDKLSAMAFILVPAAVTDTFADPPEIDQNLPPQYVSMNATRTWKLSDIVHVPSGRSAHIYDKTTVSGVQSNGDSSYVDAQTITYTPPKDYRGPAAINFTVSDGDSKDDPKGNVATLTLPIIVGDPDFKDTPPTFTTPNVQLEVGDTATIDLRSSTGHPNAQILQEVTYSDITPSNKALTANLNGSQLSLSVPRNTPKGTTYTVGVTLRWDKFTVPGTINVTVVGSTRPLAVAVTDDLESKRPLSSYVISPLTNDSNPYQTTGEPLKIVAAVITNSPSVGSVTFTGTQITVTPNASPAYIPIVITYTIEDATQDTDRRVNGTINFTITDVPDVVQKPSIAAAIGDDKSATIGWVIPATNGKPITSFEVKTVQTSAVMTVAGGQTSATITGLTNGTPYTFQVRAINVNGPGPWSLASDPVTPYGTPAAPAPTATVDSTNKWAPNGIVNASWPAVGATGGTTTYTYTFSNGYSGTTTGTTASTQANLAAGNYTVSVTASNTGGKVSPAGTSSGAQIQNQTVPPAVGTVGATTNNGFAPNGSITWSWAPVGGGPAVTDNLVYEVTLNGAVQGTQAGTSYSRSGLGEGTYTVTVRAINNAGGGGSSGPSAAAIAAQPVYPSVTLSGGGSAPYGQWFHLEVRDFSPNHTYSWTCRNAQGGDWTTSSPHQITTDGNGSYSGTPGHGSSGYGCYSADPAEVEINGVYSNVVDF